MRLSRKALLREVKVLEARARLNSHTIEGLRHQFAGACTRIQRLQADNDALRAEPRAAAPALAENIRLAHQLEQAELRGHEAETQRDQLMSRLLTITARHPHLLAPDEIDR